jgi:hypothetical protein
VIVTEPVAARSWKAVELFGSLRLCVSHFYLRRVSAFCYSILVEFLVEASKRSFALVMLSIIDSEWILSFLPEPLECYSLLKDMEGSTLVALSAGR